MEIPESSDEYLQTIPIPAAISIREKIKILEVGLAKTIKEAYYATTVLLTHKLVEFWIN